MDAESNQDTINTETNQPAMDAEIPLQDIPPSLQAQPTIADEDKLLCNMPYRASPSRENNPPTLHPEPQSSDKDDNNNLLRNMHEDSPLRENKPPNLHPELQPSDKDDNLLHNMFDKVCPLREDDPPTLNPEIQLSDKDDDNNNPQGNMSHEAIPLRKTDLPAPNPQTQPSAVSDDHLMFNMFHEGSPPRENDDLPTPGTEATPSAADEEDGKTNLLPNMIHQFSQNSTVQPPDDDKNDNILCNMFQEMSPSPPRVNHLPTPRNSGRR